jgi:hypothetical protein
VVASAEAIHCIRTRRFAWGVAGIVVVVFLSFMLISYVLIQSINMDSCDMLRTPHFKSNIFTRKCEFILPPHSCDQRYPWYYEPCELFGDAPREIIRRSEHIGRVMSVCSSLCSQNATEEFCRGWPYCPYVFDDCPTINCPRAL